MLGKIFHNIFKTMIAVSAMVALTGTPSYAHSKAMDMKETTKAVELRQAQRDLWIGHVFWVRNVALATKAGDVKAAQTAEQNVVKNARAIADSVAPLYGTPAADKLFGLLAGHYGAIKEYMTAFYAADEVGKDKAVAKITANANEIATFLSGANPNWPKETLMGLLSAHGGHHIAQIEAFAKNDYATEAEVWDAMKDHMYMIADALAAGIVKQFPKKF
ncbi:hypothetical protein [Geomonas propionica]|uniref:DinB family protein n=1 Tax=Geomonas propionica TaxID=2798582 RepID=A0ABS0YXE6_9BACT|nr:hypothetical protein [Geomonas propionica]MBJ6802619.1 hypothetical protein [Geomonas propionica]